MLSLPAVAADPRLPAGGQPVAVPGPWNTVSNARHGRPTYRLTVDSQRGTGLALHLPVQHSAARWFVNGPLVARQGEPGASPRGAQPGAMQQSVALGSVACPLQIVAHVSNFHMQRGGLMRSVELGDVAQLAERREAALMRDLLTVGVAERRWPDVIFMDLDMPVMGGCRRSPN